MKLPLRTTAALAAGLLAAGAARAQPEPIKFGKPDPKDFTAAPFVGDSTAAAVVLCDYGTTRFQLKGADFQLVTERVTRIKILKKAGYDAATVEVPLYHRNASEEKLSSLRGMTYNLTGGQVVKTKLDGATTFLEERTPNVRVRKFTLPDVREGAVIEYAYSVTSDFLFNFQDWTFQREYPVRWSEYRAAIPEYFDYKMLMQGYHTLAVNTRTEDTGQYTLHTEGGFSSAGGGLSNPGSGHVAAANDLITARLTNYHWAMKDVPAFRFEPYMTTADDYLDRIDFELAGERFPGQGYQNVAGTWSKIDDELLADDNFGKQLDRGGFLKDQLLGLAAKHPDPAARAAAVRHIVLAAVRYDGTNRYSTTGSLRKAYDAHRGTAADVNLLLIAALRGAGLPAHPVLLSTRDHGRVNQTLPLLERFNYVVALVPVAGGQDLLVDATEPLLPCGTLPERCLNQTGRLIMPKAADGRWVDLAPAQRHVHYQQVALTLDAQGGLTGKVHEEHGGYAGADARQQLATLGEIKVPRRPYAPPQRLGRAQVCRGRARQRGQTPSRGLRIHAARRRQYRRRHALSEPAARIWHRTEPVSPRRPAVSRRFRRRPRRNYPGDPDAAGRLRAGRNPQIHRGGNARRRRSLPLPRGRRRARRGAAQQPPHPAQNHVQRR